MILTGKCKDDFLKWCRQDANWIQTYEDIFLFALIIDWFDTVSYHMAIEPHIGGGDDVYYSKVIYRLPNFIDTWHNVENPYFIGEYHFPNRNEATTEAIKQANKLYNELSK